MSEKQHNYCNTMSSMNKITDQPTKTYYRSKRSHIKKEQIQINIDNMVDKLVSSIDCSAYAQYQRCQ